MSVWAAQLRLAGEVKGLLLVAHRFEVPDLQLSVPVSDLLNILLYVSDALCHKTATDLSSGSFLLAISTTASFFTAGSARALLSSAVSHSCLRCSSTLFLSGPLAPGCFFLTSLCPSHFQGHTYSVNLSSVEFHPNSRHSRLDLISPVEQRAPEITGIEFLPPFKVERYLRSSALIRAARTSLWDTLFGMKNSWLRWQLGSGYCIVPTWRRVEELAALFRHVPFC